MANQRRGANRERIDKPRLTLSFKAWGMEPIMSNLAELSKLKEDEAREHLEGIRWPDGPVCPHCGECDNAAKLEGKAHRSGVTSAVDVACSSRLGPPRKRSKVTKRKEHARNQRHSRTPGETCRRWE